MDQYKEFQYVDFFESAFNSYYERVVLYVYSYCKDWNISENIVQDTYITFWENISKIDRSKTPFPYLLFIAKNKTINALNKEIVKNKHDDYLKNQELRVARSALESSTLSMVYSKEIETLVNHSMSQMSPKAKESFYLSRFKCLKNEEIAKALGISVKTVEYRMMSALRILRKNLKDFIPDKLKIQELRNQKNYE